MGNMKCYCISGLGADKRAFKNIDFGFTLIHIEWIKPISNESLINYSKRLSKQIDSSEPFILLGLSFGGLVACEISTILKPDQIILISSLTQQKDLSLIIQAISKTKLYKFIPSVLLKPPMFLAYWLFGVNQPANKKLLKEIIADTDPTFLKWSIDKILNTKSITIPIRLLRIHGTHDKLISAKKATCIDWINDGGHLMILENASTINKLLIQKTIRRPK